ncbi:MAG: MMPL family transporter, partial [Gemmatimonadetes bacterium]|nr:MMPL family transporter [Gemmatimonadota bacterium]
VSYFLYPAFLAGWARFESAVGSKGEEDVRERTRVARGRGRWVLPAAAVFVAIAGVGVLRIDTDPGLLTYFQEGSELRDGLSLIDADGGSSTVDIVVADPDGARIDDRAVFGRLDVLQDALEEDPAVGVVLSPAVLIEHARTIPLAGLLPVPTLLDLASGEAMGGVALGFVPLDRSVARFSLRMRETNREPRQAVMDRLRGEVEAAGLTTEVMAGLYDLQAQLGRLIASSLRVGIGWLLLLFLAIAAVVSRSFRVTAAMWLCLAAIPAVTLGLFGHVGVALDLITSPSANIALAIGADAMIHLTVRQRRLRGDGYDDPWARAVSQIGPPVLAATTIVCAGFGIFALSSFPPTQRFGMAVIVGTLTAAVMALAVLPRLALITEASEA